MPQGVGSASGVTGAGDVFGGRLYGSVDYKGPASYVQGGDAVDNRVFGFPNTIITLTSSLDQSQKFRAEPRPLQNGVTGWQLVWVSLTTGTVGGQAQTANTEAVAATNLSTFTVRLSAIGY